MKDSMLLNNWKRDIEKLNRKACYAGYNNKT